MLNMKAEKQKHGVESLKTPIKNRKILIEIITKQSR
jgi:hypothetical protein